MIKIPFDEQETTVCMDFSGGVSYVYSSRPKDVLRLRKMTADYPGDTSIYFDTGETIEISVPHKWIKIKPPTKRADAAKYLTKGDETE